MMEIEIILLIAFVIIDLAFLGTELYFRRRELREMQVQTELMKKKKRRKKDNPSKRNN
jgi:hypothetical protein